MPPVDPDTLCLRTYPDPILRERGVEVDPADANVREVALRMVEIMRAEQGIGLAAQQVGLAWRLFVAEVPADPDDPQDNADPSKGVMTATAGPMVAINPEVVEPARMMTPLEEGCLSLPDIRGEVIRPEEVVLRAFGIDGEPYEIRTGGLLAKCVQHEFDHIEGTLILDRMTQMSRLKARSAVRALEKRAGG